MRAWCIVTLLVCVLAGVDGIAEAKPVFEEGETWFFRSDERQFFIAFFPDGFMVTNDRDDCSPMPIGRYRNTETGVECKEYDRHYCAIVDGERGLVAEPMRLYSIVVEPKQKRAVFSYRMPDGTKSEESYSCRRVHEKDSDSPLLGCWGRAGDLDECFLLGDADSAILFDSEETVQGTYTVMGDSAVELEVVYQGEVHTTTLPLHGKGVTKVTAAMIDSMLFSDCPEPMGVEEMEERALTVLKNPEVDEEMKLEALMQFFRLYNCGIWSKPFMRACCLVQVPKVQRLVPVVEALGRFITKEEIPMDSEQSIRDVLEKRLKVKEKGTIPTEHLLLRYYMEKACDGKQKKNPVYEGFAELLMQPTEG